MARIDGTPHASLFAPSLLAAVGVGGALGTLARYELERAIVGSPGALPWATLLVNVAGAFALGVIAELIFERWSAHRFARPLLGIGVCGGFTTFSTWMVETSLLVRDGHVAMGVLNLVVTLVGGVGALVAGVLMVRRVTGGVQ